ncbi:Kelch-like protein 10 [Harpegnathos saltator]|uniref:Kelch-like protein 10 n=1 Tax=Harpegnathos saltator TaxID=610380 RepID=E2BH38_HARSA|nr:Kelch-like protein 10 [Harpegnathos saltator]
MYVSGSSTVAYVECYDADYNEWYDASPMNLSRSALSACVIAGLENAREYSYLDKARDLGQGQATSKSEEKSGQPGEVSVETNVIIAVDEGGQMNVSELVGPIDGVADGIGNFYEEEMRDELLYVAQELD